MVYRIIKIANECCTKKINFILDEFANIGMEDVAREDFAEVLHKTKNKEIMIMICVQTIKQLSIMYPGSYKQILEEIMYYIHLGSSDMKTVKFMSMISSIPVSELTNMSAKKLIFIKSDNKPVLLDKYSYYERIK